MKKMIGGRLCEGGELSPDDNDKDENGNTVPDIYTKGRLFLEDFPHLWLDENNENIIIKSIKSRSECDNIKTLSERFDFVPRYYGCYTCDITQKRPRYKKPGEFDEIKVKNNYLVMERLNGRSIDDTSRTFEEKLELLQNNIDEIYEKYELLCDNGVDWGDLYGRNVVIGDDGKIYFIDFDEQTDISDISKVSIQKRSKDDLLNDMIRDLYNANNRKLPNINSIGGKYKKNKSRKTRKTRKSRRKSRKIKIKNKK